MSGPFTGAREGESAPSLASFLLSSQGKALSPTYGLDTGEPKGKRSSPEHLACLQSPHILSIWGRWLHSSSVLRATDLGRREVNVHSALTTTSKPFFLLSCWTFFGAPAMWLQYPLHHFSWGYLLICPSPTFIKNVMWLTPLLTVTSSTFVLSSDFNIFMHYSSNTIMTLWLRLILQQNSWYKLNWPLFLSYRQFQFNMLHWIYNLFLPTLPLFLNSFS